MHEARDGASQQRAVEAQLARPLARHVGLSHWPKIVGRPPQLRHEGGLAPLGIRPLQETE